MPVAKPTLGYRSRTAAVLALRGQRMGTTAIAELIGIPPATVAALEHSAIRSGRRRDEDHRTVRFPVALLEAMQPHADARGISANELARRIVEIVVDDGMVDAVLDDREGQHG